MITVPPPSTQIDVKRRALFLGGAMLAMAGCGRTEGKTDPVTAQPQQNQAPAAGKVVTILGDSITAGFGLASADALPAQLERRLTGMRLDVRVRAAGVSGDTTAGGLARLDFSVQDDTDLCILALGGNDMLQGIDPDAVRSNLQAIIERLKARHIAVLLAGMKAPAQYGAYAADFDRVFTDLAKQDDVETYPFLLNGVALDSRYNQVDGIHPNPQGVKIIVSGLAPVVAEALKRV